MKKEQLAVFLFGFCIIQFIILCGMCNANVVEFPMFAQTGRRWHTVRRQATLSDASSGLLAQDSNETAPAVVVNMTSSSSSSASPQALPTASQASSSASALAIPVPAVNCSDMNQTVASTCVNVSRAIAEAPDDPFEVVVLVGGVSEFCPCVSLVFCASVQCNTTVASGAPAFNASTVNGTNFSDVLLIRNILCGNDLSGCMR